MTCAPLIMVMSHLAACCNLVLSQDPPSTLQEERGVWECDLLQPCHYLNLKLVLPARPWLSPSADIATCRPVICETCRPVAFKSLSDKTTPKTNL